MHLRNAFDSILLALCASSLPSLIKAQSDLYFRFSQEGSGFRSIPIQSGYVNLFRQAGLIDEQGSRFGSMSYSSSGLWFAAQLFWSDAFFNGTAMAQTPQDLYEFMFNWGLSYNKVWDPLGEVFRRGSDSLLKQVLSKWSFSLKDAIVSILQIASIDYGDPGLMDRPANFSNRVRSLSNTDLYLGNGFHPNVRIDDGLGLLHDSITYLGPSNSETVYGTLITTQFAVKQDRIMWFPAVPVAELPIRTCVTGNVPHVFHVEDWAATNLFPNNKDVGRLLVPKSEIPACLAEGVMNLPYDGEAPPVAEAALSGSLPTAEVTSSAPTSFAQFFSALRYISTNNLPWGVKETVDKLLASGFHILWGLLDNIVDLGFCAQNRPCGIHDPALTHNVGIHSGSLALTIGQHHLIDNADIGRTLKVIMTIDAVGSGIFPQYFANRFNVDIPPGGYRWRADDGAPDFAPFPSQQIFQDYMSTGDILEKLVPVTGTVVRTARMNLTTVANPIYHVYAGQNVDLLVIAVTDEYTLQAVPIFGVDPHQFGEAARTTAASQELLQIIRDFAA